LRQSADVADQAQHDAGLLLGGRRRRQTKRLVSIHAALSEEQGARFGFDINSGRDVHRELDFCGTLIAKLWSMASRTLMLTQPAEIVSSSGTRRFAPLRASFSRQPREFVPKGSGDTLQRTFT